VLDKAISSAKEDGASAVLFLCDTHCREWSITSATWRDRADSIVKGN